MKLIIIDVVTQEKEITQVSYIGKLIESIPEDVVSGISMSFLDGVLTPVDEIIVENNSVVTLHIEPGATLAGFAIGTVISLLISLALNAATNAIFNKRIKKPKRKKRGGHTGDSPTYSFEGIQDTIAQGAPIPFILGKARKGGQVISTGIQLVGGGKRQKLDMLLCMGYGELASIDDIELNGTKIASFKGASYQTRMGSASQTVMSGFEYSTNQTYYDGRDFTPSDIIYTTKNSVDRADLFVGAMSGIFHNNDEGDFLTNKSIFTVSYRAQQSTPLSWTAHSTRYVKGATVNQLFREVTIIFPTTDIYEIKLHWVSATYVEANMDGWDLTLHNVVEKIDDVRSYNGLALLGVSAIATADLNGRLPNVTAICQSKDPDASDTLVSNVNNSWAIKHILTNTAWGLGHKIPDALIDDASFVTFAAYCNDMVATFDAGTEARHEISYVGDKRTGAWDLIGDLLAVCDASLVFSEGLLKIVIDRAQTVSQAYGEANTQRDSLIVAGGRVDRLKDSVNAKYFDAEDDYSPAFVKVTNGSDNKMEDIELPGVSRQSEAVRAANRHLKELLLRTKTYTWKSPIHSLVSEPGDLVKLQYPLSDFSKGWSGYVVSGSQKTVVLDKLVTLLPATTYEIFIRHKSKNTIVNEDIASPAGEHGRVVLSSALTLSAAEEDLWVIGVKTTGVTDVYIEEVTRDTDGMFTLKGANYDPTIYDIDVLPSKISRNKIPIGDLLPIPIEQWSVRENTDVMPDGIIDTFLDFSVMPGHRLNAGDVQGSGSTYLELDADEPDIDDFFLNAQVEINVGTGINQVRKITAYDGVLKRITIDSAWATLPDTTSRYMITFLRMGEYYGGFVEFSDDETDWFELGSFVGTEGKLPVRLQGTLVYIRVTPMTATGKKNENGVQTETITVLGKDIEPSDITNFSVVQVNDTLLFTWSNVTDLDIHLYQIRRGTSWEQSQLVGEAQKNVFETADFIPGAVNYLIKAKDRTGNFSTNAVEWAMTLEEPNSRVVITTTNELLSLSGTFDGLVIKYLSSAVPQGIGLSPQTKWDSGLVWDAGSSASSGAVEFWDSATVLLGTYVTQIFDIGAIAFARITAEIGFDDSTGMVFLIEEAHSDDNITFSDWRIIGPGDQRWRYAKLRITISAETPLDNPIIDKFTVVIDALVRSFRGINTNVPANSAGLSVEFETSLIQVPFVQVTEYTTTKVIEITDVTKSGFNLSHGEVSGQFVNWYAEGV